MESARDSPIWGLREHTMGWVVVAMCIGILWEDTCYCDRIVYEKGCEDKEFDLWGGLVGIVQYLEWLCFKHHGQLEKITFSSETWWDGCNWTDADGGHGACWWMDWVSWFRYSPWHLGKSYFRQDLYINHNNHHNQILWKSIFINFTFLLTTLSKQKVRLFAKRKIVCLSAALVDQLKLEETLISCEEKKHYSHGNIAQTYLHWHSKTGLLCCCCSF